MHQLENGRLSGPEIRRLMRVNGVTISKLKEITGITLKRIREVRIEGLENRNAIRDWLQAITGDDPGPV